MGSIGAHRDPRVAHRHDPGLYTNFVAPELRWVARAVIALVVLAHDLGNVAQARGEREHLGADVGVAAQELPLLEAQGAGLATVVQTADLLAA